MRQHFTNPNHSYWNRIAGKSRGKLEIERNLQTLETFTWRRARGLRRKDVGTVREKQGTVRGEAVGLDKKERVSQKSKQLQMTGGSHK